MITFEQLRDFRPGELAAARELWDELDRVLGACADRVAGEVVPPLRWAWSGPAGRRAATVLDARGGALAAASAAVTGARTALDHAERRLTALREELAAAERDAAAAGFVLGPGGVPLPGPGHAERYAADETGALAAEAARTGLADRVRAALVAADEADRACAELLDRLRPAGPVPGGPDAAVPHAADAARLLGLSAADVPAGDPAAAASWWAGLPPERRELYADAFPRLIGATDGLPALVRDRANRRVLAEAVAAGPGALARADARSGPVPDLANLLALRRGLDEHAAASGERALLLAFDPAGDGRAVVALGDPDTARHVAVHVPGTGADLRGLDGHLRRASRLREAADPLTPERFDVATVAWLGYDAPDDLPAAAGRGPAREGAPALDRFVTGLRAQGGPDRHVTVLGHSYGSVVVGDAARAGDGLPADDIVAIGSPGMHVAHARELGVGPGHVWSAAAGGDVVPSAGRLLHGAGGRVPADTAFGAGRLEAGGGGHGSYWDVDAATGAAGPALEGQARVVTGRYADPDPAARPRPEHRR